MASTTNPGDWFLGGVPYTEGNHVTPLVDGEAYFAALVDRLDGLGTGASVALAGWRADPTTPLDVPGGRTVADVLGDVLRDGAKVRSLLWYVPGSIGELGAGHGVENAAFARFVADGGGEAVLDDRLPPGRFASHHQKFVIAADDAAATAFVGGIDLAPDRWDTTAHDGDDGRDPELFQAWHDVQVRVEGPAVGELWDRFRQRWDDPRRPHRYPAPGGSVPTPLTDAERPAPPDGALSTHAVQVLETYACTSVGGDGGEQPYPFAPSGTYTYRRALVEAIGNAEHYVYVEDQYLWPCAVVDALAAAAARGVAVILVLSRSLEVAGMEPFHNFLRAGAIDAIRRSGEDRTFVFHLEQPAPDGQETAQIYLHAKTLVIDDRYLAIGSANVNERSMQTDSEIGIAVVDTSPVDSVIGGRPAVVGAAIRDYRKALWSEHLGGAGDDPLDDQGRPAGFPTGEARVGHVRRHEVPQPRFCAPAVIPFGLMNARTTCG